MQWDRFDIVEAHYCFCMDYHDGQESHLYKKMCRIGKYFKPGLLRSGFDSLSENGKEIYLQLVRGLK